ncbi:hypothetical protein ACEQ8H_004549 [Pleosporales sp. CAS-2024a]
MDEPARKRRRTNSPEERAASPLRKPARRPSFASPTKASLARNYPNLLPSRPAPPASPSRPSSRGDMLARGKQARADRLGETVDEEEGGLPTTPSQRGLEEQHGPRRSILFSSPSKRPPRAKGAVKQSPLRSKAPPVQETSSSRRLEDGPVDAVAEEEEEAKQAEPLDPEIERRKQEKARLQRELAILEKQLSQCTQEIVKEQQRGPDEALNMVERAELQDFIGKISGEDADAQAAVPVSSLLCSFLPFSILSIPPPRNTSPKKPVPSHRPVHVADPLPYLEMFTSLKYSTQVALPRGKFLSSSKRVHQRHTIDIVGPQKLLTAQLSVIIDTLANEVIDMHIMRLSPWAERELGTFLRKCAAEKDLANACWAIGSYWDIAYKRAQHWYRVEQAFAHLLVGHAREDRENVRARSKASTKVSRRDLNRHMGRDSLILQDKHVLLKLDWRIDFDWMGEAESEVTVEPAFPGVWTEADTEKTLNKVPGTFASLLQSRGVFEATRVMIALLFTQ